MSGISERLGIGSDVRELKIGKSFMANTGTAFHSIRYDFKPASVDTSKIATLAIGERQQVTCTVPHMEGNAQTVFMGSKKPYQKECVLIIDHNTGEITLEKLTGNIQLKKTRAEGSSKMTRPITPIENHLSQQASAVPSVSSHHKRPSPSHSKSSPSHSKSSPSHLRAGANQLSPGVNQRSSPWASNSPQGSPANPSSSVGAHSHPSMPNILSGGIVAPTINQTSSNPTPRPNSLNSSHRSNPHQPSSSTNLVSPSMPNFGVSNNNSAKGINEPQPDLAVPEVGVLSDSSSDSSSGEEENSSDEELRQNLIKEQAILSRKATTRSSSGSSSSSAGGNLSEAEPDPPRPEPSKNEHKKHSSHGIKNGGQGNSGSSMPSMPKFSQLSEDLQLSESGSDSDD